MKLGYALSFVAGKTNNVLYRSVISDIFDGKLSSSVQCLTCERVGDNIKFLIFEL